LPPFWENALRVPRAARCLVGDDVNNTCKKHFFDTRVFDIRFPDPKCPYDLKANSYAGARITPIVILSGSHLGAAEFEELQCILNHDFFPRAMFFVVRVAFAALRVHDIGKSLFLIFQG